MKALAQGQLHKGSNILNSCSTACVPELQELLTPLGLAAMRTQRLILFANMYLHDPPSQSNLRPSRVQVAKGGYGNLFQIAC